MTKINNIKINNNNKKEEELKMTNINNIKINNNNKKEEEVKMTKINNIKINNNNKKEEEQRMENIKEVRKVILEEMSYITESCFYIKEKGYDRVHELRALGEILNKGIEKIYNIRTERGVLEEELGREYDEGMAVLYRWSFNVDHELKKWEEEIRKMTEDKKEEEIKMKKMENIKIVEETILKEMANVMERYTIIKRENFDKIKELKKIQETILHSIEKIYNIRVKLNVSDEELGENFDRIYFSLQLISFDVDRELEKEIKKITEDKKEEESKMTKKMMEEYNKILKAEEEILMEIEALEDNIANTEAQGYGPLEEAEIKKEDVSYALEMISTILLLEDLTEGDLLEDVRSKISDVRRREEEIDSDLAYWREEYGVYYEGPAYHKASPYELR